MPSEGLRSTVGNDCGLQVLNCLLSYSVCYHSELSTCFTEWISVMWKAPRRDLSSSSGPTQTQWLSACPPTSRSSSKLATVGTLHSLHVPENYVCTIYKCRFNSVSMAAPHWAAGYWTDGVSILIFSQEMWWCKVVRCLKLNMRLHRHYVVTLPIYQAAFNVSVTVSL